MDKKPLKKLRIRKENLKALKTEQLVRVHAGAQAGLIADPWDPTVFPCTVA